MPPSLAKKAFSLKPPLTKEVANCDKQLVGGFI